MKLARNFEHYAPHHAPILTTAAFQGVNVEPTVQGATRLIGYGDTKHGYGPTCILDMIHTPYVIEPHVIWFPWTASKHRIAHFKWAMELMAQSHQVLLNVEKKEIALFEHFVKKGLLRKIGHIENLPIVEEIHMYQVKRSSHE